MAIAFRAAGAVAGADSGNVASIGLPAGHASGDLLLLAAVQFDNVASTVTGYTLLASQTNGASMTTRIFGKFDNGAESAPTLTHAAGGVTHCVITAWSGVDNSLGLGVGAGQVLRDAQSQTGTTASETFPALTGVQTGDMLVTHLAQAGTDTSGAATNNWATPPVGFTERYDTGRISATTGHVVAELSSKLAGTFGSGTNTGNATGFAGTLNWIGFQLAITSVTPAVVAGDPQLWSEVSGPGVDYGPYAFIEERVDVGVAGPLTIPWTLAADAVLATASMARSVNKNVTGTAVAVTASFVKQINKALTATAVAVTATLATVKVKLLAMTATTVVATASMLRQVNKNLTGTVVAVTASMVRQVNKSLTASSVVVTASLATIKVKLLALTATAVVVTASFLNRVNKALTATSIVVTASRQLQVNKAVRATNVVVTASLVSVKVKLQAMTATAVAVTATMSRRVNTGLAATVAVSASVVKQITHKLTATVNATASLVALFVGPIVGPFKALLSILDMRGTDVTTGDAVNAAVSTQDALGTTVTVADPSGPSVSTQDAAGADVTITDINT